MATYQVFIGDIDTEQYANLYEQNLIPFVPTYYNLQVNVNFSNMFNTHNFQQTGESDPANANLVNVRLSMNTEVVNSLLGASGIDSSGLVDPLATGSIGVTGGKNNGSIDGALTSGHDNVATRILEIVAIHIFGHGRARAAIRNDSEYAASMKIVRDQVNALFTQDKANDFFNQYVNMNKITSSNDVNESQDFNFENIELGYRVNFLLTNTLDSNDQQTTLVDPANAAGWTTNILLKFVHVA